MNTLANASNPATLEGRAQLDHWGVIRASGDDAVAFLQGQITHDVALLKADRARYAAYCNAQGRILANFVLFKQGNEVWVVVPQETLEALIKRWRMFVLRAKCVLEDVSASHPVHGVWGAAATPYLGGSVWSVTHVAEPGQDSPSVGIQLPDAPVGVAGEQAIARALVVGASAEAAQASSQWDWLDIQSGLAWVTAATAGSLVPQMINMESLDGVSFKKGCYPGQEVVARSQFRGAIKRRGERILAEGPIAVGADVFANGQPVGVVVNVAPTTEGKWASLVSVHVSEADGHDWHIGTADGPLAQRCGLPYELLTDI